MAFSLESRVPFLDYRLVNFLFTIPAEQKINDGITKLILRKSLANDLPDEILNRKDKIGFATPEQKWMRTTLAEVLSDVFHSKGFQERGLYKMPVLIKYFDDFLAGKFETSYIIWRWFNLEKWFQLVESRFRSFS